MEFPVDFSATEYISAGYLKELVEIDNRSFKAKEKPGGYSTEPEVGYGCGRTSSTNASEWALLGVSNGMEEWEAGEAKVELSPTSARTEFDRSQLKYRQRRLRKW
jgi:hypothetical protein